MAILPINVYGDNILRKKARKVTEIDDKTIKLIKDMFDSMHNANGIGLAANQVGTEKSIFVVDVSVVEGYEKYKPIVFINPEFSELSKDLIFMEEGCLSLSYLRAEVERPKIIQIKYLDTDLKEHSLEADKLLARVIQHEYDHLQGKMFVDRISEEERRNLKPDLEDIKKRNIDPDYLITPKKSLKMS